MNEKHFFLYKWKSICNVSVTLDWTMIREKVGETLFYLHLSAVNTDCGQMRKKERKQERKKAEDRHR